MQRGQRTFWPDSKEDRHTGCKRTKPLELKSPDYDDGDDNALTADISKYRRLSR